MWATRRSVAAAYTVVIPFIFAYLSLLIRMVEDPFTYPARYNQNCLLQSKREVPPLSWVILPQVLRCSIDLHILTVCFGRRFKKRIPDMLRQM